MLHVLPGLRLNHGDKLCGSLQGLLDNQVRYETEAVFPWSLMGLRILSDSPNGVCPDGRFKWGILLGV